MTSDTKLSMNSLLLHSGVSGDSIVKLNAPNVDKADFKNACAKAMLEVTRDRSIGGPGKIADAAMSILLKWWLAGKQTNV